MRVFVAYATSLLMHVGVLTWLGLANGDAPLSARIPAGRAGPTLIARIDATAFSPNARKAPVEVVPASQSPHSMTLDGPTRNTQLDAGPLPRRSSEGRPPVVPLGAGVVGLLPPRRAAASMVPGQPITTLTSVERTMAEFVPDGANAATPSVGQQGALRDDLPFSLETNDAPPYPIEELAAGHQGRVELAVSIDSEGLVTHVSVARSCGFGKLDEAALATVRKWRFAPARRQGAPVAWQGVVPIRFRISAN